MYAGKTFQLTIFPLSLRDMRLSTIIPSIFLQVFAHAINLRQISVSELPWIPNVLFVNVSVN